MELTWIAVAIGGCVALALCIAVALLGPLRGERARLRPVANATRLTRLPEYVRAQRLRTVATVTTIVLLVVIFGGAVIAATRPTGLPTAARPFDGRDPEDVMVCIGAAPDDPAVSAPLQYFADAVAGFGTERIGLTTPTRRVIPLTRDYQFARGVFATYAQPDQAGGDRAALSPAVSYVDYAGSVDDVLAQCLTGFPRVDQKSPQRRSVVYVGPGELRSADDPRPALFDRDRIRRLATGGGVQVNAVITGADSSSLSDLVRDTGGRTFPADSGLTAHLTEIRAHPPAAGSGDGDGERRLPPESPDVPLALALLAAVALAALPVVWRR